jgi:hypothetical protein
MALNDRQKKGLGFIVTGVLFLGVGIITLAFNVAPGWVPTVLTIVSAVAGVIGLSVTLPDA